MHTYLSFYHLKLRSPWNAIVFHGFPNLED
jgi:hypothetical protein